MVKTDIMGREDLLVILGQFYDRAFADQLIGTYFTEIAQLDLEAHLPRIADFWESILFGTVRYQGNVMHKHVPLDKAKPMEEAHFDRWMALLKEVVGSNYRGPKATQMLERGQLVASTMGYKLSALRN